MVTELSCNEQGIKKFGEKDLEEISTSQKLDGVVRDGEVRRGGGCLYGIPVDLVPIHRTSPERTTAAGGRSPAAAAMRSGDGGRLGRRREAARRRLQRLGAAAVGGGGRRGSGRRR